VTRARRVSRLAPSNVRRTPVKNLIFELKDNDKGQDLIEYGLLVGIITVGAIASIKLIGPKVQKYFDDLNALL
jgi:Flp pilus assembly pilin Flp